MYMQQINTQNMVSQLPPPPEGVIDTNVTDEVRYKLIDYIQRNVGGQNPNPVQVAVFNAVSVNRWSTMTFSSVVNTVLALLNQNTHDMDTCIFHAYVAAAVALAEKGALDSHVVSDAFNQDWNSLVQVKESVSSIKRAYVATVENSMSMRPSAPSMFGGGNNMSLNTGMGAGNSMGGFSGVQLDTPAPKRQVTSNGRLRGASQIPSNIKEPPKVERQTTTTTNCLWGSQNKKSISNIAEKELIATGLTPPLLEKGRYKVEYQNGIYNIYKHEDKNMSYDDHVVKRTSSITQLSNLGMSSGTSTGNTASDDISISDKITLVSGFNSPLVLGQYMRQVNDSNYDILLGETEDVVYEFILEDPMGADGLLSEYGEMSAMNRLMSIYKTETSDMKRISAFFDRYAEVILRQLTAIGGYTRVFTLSDYLPDRKVIRDAMSDYIEKGDLKVPLTLLNSTLDTIDSIIANTEIAITECGGDIDSPISTLQLSQTLHVATVNYHINDLNFEVVSLPAYSTPDLSPTFNAVISKVCMAFVKHDIESSRLRIITSDESFIDVTVMSASKCIYVVNDIKYGPGAEVSY